jgi:hypothetical protein
VSATSPSSAAPRNGRTVATGTASCRSRSGLRPESELSRKLGGRPRRSAGLMSASERLPGRGSQGLPFHQLTVARPRVVRLHDPPQPASVSAHGVETVVVARRVAAPVIAAHEGDVLADRRPRRIAVATVVPGQPPQPTAICRHGKDAPTGVEGESAPVRRPVGLRPQPPKAAKQAPQPRPVGSDAAKAIGQSQLYQVLVVVVQEGDAALTDQAGQSAA